MYYEPGELSTMDETLVLNSALNIKLLGVIRQKKREIVDGPGNA